MRTVKWVAVLMLVLAMGFGCRSIVAGLTTATSKTAVAAEEMKESESPYVALAGWLAAAVAAGTGGILAKIRKKANIEEREMTEQEAAMFESLATTLAQAIEVTNAGKVKKAVASATKHDYELADLLEGVLANLPPVKQ